MMDSRRSRNEVFSPMRIDRKRIGQQKVEKLQQQIQDFEKEIDEKQNLARKISRHRQIEATSEEQRSRILEKYENAKSPGHEDRNSRTAWGNQDARPSMLGNEMERLYGRESAQEMKIQVQDRVIEDVMAQRNREFNHKQNESAMQAKYLSMERQWIQAARERLREKKTVMRGFISPVSSPDSADSKSVTEWPVWLYRPGSVTQPPLPPHRSPRSPESVRAHSVESLINETVEQLPETMDRILKLRHEIDQRYEKYGKPYKGELGVHSYKPAQMNHYFMVRSVVDEIVDNFLNIIFTPAHPLIERAVYSAMIRSDQDDGAKLSMALAERTAVQLIADEIFLDVTGDLADAVCWDVLHMYGTVKNKVDNMMMRHAEISALKNEDGRPEQDPDYSIFTQSFFETQRYRNLKWQDIWGLSQPLQLSDVSDKEEQEIIEEPDVVLLDYNLFIPIDLKKYEPLKSDPITEIIKKDRFKKYQHMERNYWKKMKATMIPINLASKCHGIQCAQPSHSQSFLAAGTVHGDIIVYRTESWRPVRFFNNDAKQDDPIIDITWTLDNTQLITITKAGVLQQWSFTGGVSASTTTKLKLNPDNHGMYPKTLNLKLQLDVSWKHFMFQQGPLFKQKVLEKNHGPVKAVFFPNLTITGSQNTIVVGLDNGDLMKCDLEMALGNPLSKAVANQGTFQKASKFINHKITGLMDAPNVIGKNIEADLFRQHRYQVLFMGHVDNLKDLVTVDQKGYIYFWKYTIDSWNKCGWFEPFKKLKLKLEKTTYVPSTGKKNIIFMDQSKPGVGTRTRPRTRQDNAKERQDAQSVLDDVELGDPWHEELNRGHDSVTSLYAPRVGAEEGTAMFHVVMRSYSTKQLTTYFTHLYNALKIKCKLMEVKPIPSGGELVFLLLFPKCSPKPAHMTVVVMNLNKMDLWSYRRDMNLTDIDYTEMAQQNNASLGISRVLGPTGSEYLFIVNNGKLKGISLTTGNLVFLADDPEKFPDFNGSFITSHLLKLTKVSKVTTLCAGGKIYAVSFAKKHDGLTIVKLEDENDEFERMEMRKTYKALCLGEARGIANEFPVDPVNWQIDTHHHAAAMRSLILECVDRGLTNKGDMVMTEQKRQSLAISDKINNYLILEDEIERATFLEDEDDIDS